MHSPDGEIIFLASNPNVKIKGIGMILLNELEKQENFGENPCFTGIFGRECNNNSPLGTEELAHFEMIGTIVHQLTRNLSMEEIENSGLGPYYIDHTIGIWPQAAGGIPFNACEFQSKGDVITDLTEDMAADATQLHPQPYLPNIT